MREEKERINIDLLKIILKQLAVKTLLRLRCVSKLFCSIIDDPEFIQSHHNHSHTRPGAVSILVMNKVYGYYEFYSVDPEGGRPVHLLRVPRVSIPYYDCCDYEPEYKENLQSVNGLVCMQNRIWNPSTRERIAIPPRKMSTASFLDFEVEELPRSELRFYSTYFLGFDPFSNKYKILNKFKIMSRRGSEMEHRVEYKILTIGTNSWRDIDSVPLGLLPFNYGRNYRSCCIGGIIYCFECISNEDVILAFELRDEKFRIIPLPQCSRYISDYYLIQVRECLAIIDYEVTTIWILEDFENILWNRQSFIFPDHYEGKPLVDEWDMRIHFEPIGVIHTGEILLRSPFPFDVYQGPTFFYYDMESKRLRMVDELSEEYDHICGTKHVESLFRLKG